MMNINQYSIYGKYAPEYLSRPMYPNGLFEFLGEVSKRRDTVWDCGCGSGQASIGLSKYFNDVIATDVSFEQIKNAPKIKNVTYKQCSAEKSGLEHNSVDLISSFMAAHWFNMPEFYSEAMRVGKNGSLVAIFAYAEPTTDNHYINEHLSAYSERIKPYGGPCIQRMRNNYTDIEFPFNDEIVIPKFYLTAEMTLNKFLTYTRSRASVVDYLNNVDENSLIYLQEKICDEWGDASIRVQWPLHGRAGYIVK